MYRTFLVPIDGSAASNVAIDFAITIAKSRCGALTFCNALDMRALGMESSVAVDPGWIETLRPNAEKVGQEALFRAAAQCPATLRIEVGLVEDVVRNLAPAFDIVVIGTRAIHGLAQVATNSVADAVLETCPRPVLVVRSSDPMPKHNDAGVVGTRLIVPIDRIRTVAGGGGFRWTFRVRG